VPERGYNYKVEKLWTPEESSELNERTDVRRTRYFINQKALAAASESCN